MHTIVTIAFTVAICTGLGHGKTPACGTVPGSAPWACDSSATPNAWPAAAGVLNVKDSPFNAVGDGKHDDTAAIQAAVLNSTLMQSIFFPKGIYKISKPIVCKNWHAELAKGIVLQGESQDLSRIQLEDRSPAFQNATNITGLFIFGAAPAQNFANLVESLTISTGSENPGAAALQFNANNEGGVFNVTLQSEDKNAAVGLDLSFCGEIGPLMVQYVTVVGCRVGVKMVHGPDSITMEHVAVLNASEAGLLHSEQDVFVRDLSVMQLVPGVPAIVSQSNGAHGTELTLVDSTFTFGGELAGRGNPASAMFLDESALFARNVTTTGFNGSINDNGTFPLGGSDFVKEYSSNGVARPFNDSPSVSLGLEIQEAPWVSLPPPTGTQWVSMVGPQPLYHQGHCPKPWLMGRGLDVSGLEWGLLKLGVTLEAQHALGSSSLLFDVDCRPVGWWNDASSTAVPIPGLALPSVGNTTCVCGGKGECYDEMVAAASSGAPVLFVPACGDGWPLGLQNQTAPPVVRVGGGVTHIVGAGSRIQGYGVLESVGETDVPLTVMRMKMGPYAGLITIRQSSSSRPLLLRSIQGLSLEFGNLAGTRSDSATLGSVFTVDTVGHSIWVPKGGRMWSRQLNLENRDTDLVIEGGKTWVLGLKTEKGNSGIANVTAGGELELLGVFSYATSGPYYDVPVFHANESGRLSATWGSDCFRDGADRFKVFLREERGAAAEQVIYGDPGIFGRSGNAGFTLGTMGTGW